MNAPAYHRLSREQLAQLLAPDNVEAERAWSSLTGSLHAIICMLSVTHPRPLYWDDRYDHERMARDPEQLRGTPFYDTAIRNVRAAQEIERMFRERGHTPEIDAIVDGYIDDLLDEFEAIRLYPEIPPRRDSDTAARDAESRRAASGR